MLRLRGTLAIVTDKSVHADSQATKAACHTAEFRDPMSSRPCSVGEGETAHAKKETREATTTNTAVSTDAPAFVQLRLDLL